MNQQQYGNLPPNYRNPHQQQFQQPPYGNAQQQQQPQYGNPPPNYGNPQQQYQQPPYGNQPQRPPVEIPPHEYDFPPSPFIPSSDHAVEPPPGVSRFSAKADSLLIKLQGTLSDLKASVDNVDKSVKKLSAAN